MNFEMFYRLVKRNAQGKVVKDSGLIPIRSYVIQFLEYLEGMWDAETKQATDIDGTEQNITQTGVQCLTFGLANAPAGDDTYGVLVGTNAGATVEDNLNYKLDTKIEHSGTGEAGKMNHQIVVFDAPEVLGASVDFDVSRAYINETGSSITVKEIAIYIKNTNVTKYHMILRDVIAEQVVDDAETLTVTYTLRTTV